MITLTAKINLLGGNNSALSLGSPNLSGNNISRDLGSVIGNKKIGSNPFLLGVSKFGDGSTFSNSVDYFIGNQIANDNGFFPSPYDIELNSSSPMKSLILKFDDFNNRHPKKVSIGKIEITSGEGEKTETAISTVDKEAENYNNDNYGYTIIASANVPYNLEFNAVFDKDEFGYNDKNNRKVTYKSASARLSAGGLSMLAENKKIVKTEDDTSIRVTFSCTVTIEDGIENETPVYISCTIRCNADVSYTETIPAGGKEFILLSEHTCDDPILLIQDFQEENLKNIVLRISDWNTPNYPIVITGIYSDVSIEIDRRNLISIDRSIFDRSDLKLPSFGIISNTGNIEFNDTNGEIRDYAEQLLLQSGLKCEINLNNTLADNASETIGLFETDQWNYENDSRVVSVSLKDDLEEWQDINVPEISYDPRVLESKPFSWLYEHLWKLTSNRSSYVNEKGETIIGKGNYNMLSIVELDEDTQAVLQKTYTKYPLLKSGTLWQQWTKLCQVCQLHIYKNNNGEVVCRYNGGN